MDPGALARAEAAFLVARNTRDRLDVAGAEGTATPGLEAAADGALAGAEAALEAVAGDATPDPDDARALATMREIVAGWRADADAGAAPAANDAFATLTRHLAEAYAANATAIRVGEMRLERLDILGRLARESDPAARRELFFALEPLWRAIDGDGGDGSPYRRLIEASAGRWRAGGSPIEANARALGVDAAAIGDWCRAILRAWRSAVVEPDRAAGRGPIAPWDWAWAMGEAERRLAGSVPVDRLRSISDAWHAALGAAPVALGIHFDVTPRPGRPPVPVAYTTFDGRPARASDGEWTRGRPTVFATYAGGGLGELTELIHETGHAIHLAAIRTRPAFADCPDSDALTEAIAELTALDTASVEWLVRWVGPAAEALPAGVAIRCRYAEVAMDAAWALFEIELHADPSRRPNDVWTAITTEWLGVAPLPGSSWWAVRGQLVDEPGYMANYALGAVLAADLRAAIRAARGGWTGGDPGWYAWVSEHMLRFGRARGSGDVVREILGRPPSVDALVVEIGRAGATAGAPASDETMR